MAKESNPQNHIITCIGASADGIKALEEFFSNLPESKGLTFVVIQHLSPDHKSILGNILQRKTGLKVEDIKDRAALEPDHVYVLPAGYDATIKENRFRLKKYRKEERGLHLPVDIFLRSLAADRKDTIAAILLSGTGSDGSQGIREIKNAGGLVMVQDPESAKFKSMPQNALETGLVDKVAPPGDLPELLLEFQKNCHEEIKPFDEEITGELLEKLLQRVYSQTGYDFSGYKQATIHRRIRRRMALHKKTKLRDYLHLLEAHPDETEHLFKEFLIGVTSFFRNEQAFDALREEVFPEILAADTRETLRIWIPACATGEEVYSIAILAKEYQALKKIRKDMQFFATDVDQKALEVARAGKYKENIKADLPETLLDKYFKKINNMYQVHKDIRDMVTFAQHNALVDPPYSNLDLISCRNFLIYLEPALQKNLLNTFHYALKAGGYLFLGSSETHSGRNDLFESINTKARIYRKKPNKKAILDYLSQARGKEPDLTKANAGEHVVKKKSLKEFLADKALTDFMHPVLLVDKKGEIQYSLGPCEKYFRFPAGEPNQNIVNLAREGLKTPLSGSLRKINANNETVTFKGAKVNSDGGEEFVNLTITPVKKPSYLAHLLIVSLEPTPVDISKTGEKRAPAREKTDSPDDYIRQMEQELQETREYLHNVIEELETSNEELKSANEEAQSTNEELQSTNEELETSKEETQSLNEELETSNNELHRKIEEVTNINNDLNNFLKSTEIGILFLDKHLKIRRFSPQIRQIISLRESDIGRSVKDFGIRFLQEDFVQDVRKVIDHLVTVEKEISTPRDGQFWMRISPYRTIDDRIDGVVITFTDITERNRTQKLRDEAERLRKYMHLFHHIQHGFALYQVVKNEKGTPHDLSLMEANQAFRKMIQALPDKSKDKLFYDLFSQKDYRETVLKKIDSGKAFHQEIDFSNLNTHLKILFFTHEEDFIAAFVQDITHEKKELKAQKHLASIVESTEDAIFSESLQGTILSWNNGAANLYGYSEKEAVGLKSSVIYYDMKEARLTIQNRKGEAVQSMDSVHKTKDGALVPVSITKSPIYDEMGNVIAISNVVKDISRIKEREKELLEAREKAEEAALIKTRFLENMSHEIRTPLNSILGFAEMLRDEVKTNRSVKFVETINNSGKQLLHLISDIVDFSRLEAGELPLQYESVNVAWLLEKAVDEFEGFTTEHAKKVDLKLNLPGEAKDMYLSADIHRLQQILHNLLSNAFKYTDKGHVELGLEIPNKKTLLFYVSDTGPGLDKKYHHIIFERFRQGDEALRKETKKAKGTGLGLAIALKLTEKMGGEMWVESEIGKGSKFCFTIPYKKGKSVCPFEERHSGEPLRVPQLKGKNVIVAEDDPYSLEMIKQMLGETGVNMFIAKEGNKVMELFNSKPVDLLFLDIRMPGKDGFEVVREIRKKNPRIPVIAQSAYAMPDQIKKSKDAGFDDHLVKPLSREKLYGILNKYLGQQ